MFFSHVPKINILIGVWAGLLLFQSVSVRCNPEAAERHWRLAESYLEKSMIRHALAEAEVTFKLDPEHTKAKALLQAHNGATDMSAVGGLYFEAIRAYRSNRIAAADRLCGDILRKDPTHADARKLREAIAEETYRPLPLAANDLLRQLFEQGLGFYRREEWEEALDAFRKGVSMAPEHGQFQTFYGRCRAELESKRIAALLSAARRARAGGRHSEARESLLKVLAINPDCSEARKLRDQWGYGPDEEARRERSRLHFNRGVEAYEQGRWEDAAREWELVTGLTPDDDEAGRLLRKARGKLAAARRKARKRTAALHEEALGHFQRGRREEARKLYMRILEIDPEDEKARKNLTIVGGGAGRD